MCTLEERDECVRVRNCRKATVNGMVPVCDYFKVGDIVRITSGLGEGRTATIVDLSPAILDIMLDDGVTFTKHSSRLELFDNEVSFWVEPNV